jgi:GH18 family chitinase
VRGGALSDAFSDIALTDASRKRFTISAAKFVDKYGFDDIDIDSEYPFC